MKLFKKVLREEVLESVLIELSENIEEDVWGSNRRFWNPRLLSNNLGTVSVKTISDKLKIKVLDSLKNILPKSNNIVVQMYVWDTNSGISIHDDSSHVFAATVYLNKTWDANFGGWFIWQEKDEWKVLLPEYNTLVLNDEKQNHTVTPISHQIPEARYTLQIFGKD